MGYGLQPEKNVEFFPSGNSGQYQLSLYALSLTKPEGLDAIVPLR